MRRFSFTNQCPLCAQAFRYRIRRNVFMRAIPGSRHYLCDYCGYTALSIFKRAAIRLGRLPLGQIKAVVNAARVRTKKIDRHERAARS